MAYASPYVVYTNGFLQPSSDRMESVAKEYVMFVANALHTVVTNVSHDRLSRLLIKMRAWSYSSIIMP